MTACEKCWGQAFIESRYGPESQVEAYHRILDEIDSGTRPGHDGSTLNQCCDGLDGLHHEDCLNDV